MTRSRQTADWGSRAGLAKIVPSSVAVGSGTGSADTLGTVTFSAVSSVALNGVFSSSYNRYLILLELQTNTAVDRPIVYFRASGTNTTTGYYWGNVGRTSSAVALDTQASNGSYIDFNAYENLVVDDTNFYSLMVQNPATAKRTSYFFESSIWSDNTRASHMSGGGTLNNTTIYDGISINRAVAGSGTFTGTILVYGYTK
jgi:hypothetical protein